VTATCVICNQPVELERSARIEVAEPIVVSDKFDANSLPKVYDAHPECLRRVAHPDYDLNL
jgi:hypothetical protein